MASLWRVVLAFGAAAIGGCASHSQGLLLPTPPPPALGEVEKRSGAPLANISAQQRTSEAVGTGRLTGKPVPRSIVSAGKNGVSLNIVGASIPEAAKSILGDVLSVTYTVSDKVKGAITLQTASAVPKDALLDIFEDVLRSEGAAIVVQQGTYRILPSSEAVASAPLKGARGKYRRMPGMSTHVVPLKYVAAAEMARILKAIAPNAVLLRTDSSRNLLVVAGTRSDLDAIMDAVSVFDIDWMRGMSFGIYPLESGDPEAVAKELDTIFANDRESPTKGIVRFIPNRRLKSVLVISSRPEYLRRARTWIRRLDMATQATVKQVFVYPVRSRSAPELARLLQRIYGSKEGVKTPPRAPVSLPSPISAPTTGISPAAARTAPQMTGAPGLAEPPEPEPSPEDEPPPAPAPPSAAPSADGPRDDRLAGIGVFADAANNTLIITATAKEYRRVRQILERIDVAPDQVLLEATIVEVTLNDDLRMGVRWFFKAGNSDLRFTNFVDGAVTAAFPGFSHVFNTGNIRLVLDALSSVTDINVISSPTLMVLDNKKATLVVGDEVPVVTQSAVGVTAPDSPIVNSVSYRSTGIVLNIRPRVGENGRILLEVEQEASDVADTGSSNIDSPTIQQRRIKTTVAVNDGEAIILGGLIQNRAENTRDQLPLLGRVPILGNLFKSKNDKIARTELLVAITPRIVRDSGQIRAITEEFRARINLTTRPQWQGPPDRREQMNRLIR